MLGHIIKKHKRIEYPESVTTRNPVSGCMTYSIIKAYQMTARKTEPDGGLSYFIAIRIHTQIRLQGEGRSTA